jgi:hypothetical protein
MAEISDETYEQLQLMLESQNGKHYPLEDVKEIGEGLLDFFRLLLDFTDKQGFGSNLLRATLEFSDTLQQDGSGAPE